MRTEFGAIFHFMVKLFHSRTRASCMAFGGLESMHCQFVVNWKRSKRSVSDPRCMMKSDTQKCRFVRAAQSQLILLSVTDAVKI